MDTFTYQDYAQQLRKLMPKGPAWECAPYLDTFAHEFAQVEHFIRQLLNESLPISAVATLSEWEKDWGLPDTCEQHISTFADRKHRLIQKERDAGSPTAFFFINLAKQLGYNHAQIVCPQPCRIGARAGQRIYSLSWAYVWRLHIPEKTNIRHLKIGARIGERLRIWKNELLHCVVKRYTPAHLLFHITYGG